MKKIVFLLMAMFIINAQSHGQGQVQFYFINDLNSTNCDNDFAPITINAICPDNCTPIYTLNYSPAPWSPTSGTPMALGGFGVWLPNNPNCWDLIPYSMEFLDCMGNMVTIYETQSPGSCNPTMSNAAQACDCKGNPFWVELKYIYPNYILHVHY